MASERTAWTDVQRIAQRLMSLGPGELVSALSLGAQLDRTATEMLRQLRRGTHENPLLAIYGNPPRNRPPGSRSVWSRNVIDIHYVHAGDGERYEHEFEPECVSLRANPDGSVTLYRKDGRPLWDDFPE